MLLKAYTYKTNVKNVVRFYADHRIKPHVPPLV